MGKAFEKKKQNKKAIEDQGEKQKKAIEKNGKQLFESIKNIKNDFNVEKDGVSCEKHLFNRLLAKRDSEFADIKNKICYNKLIYNFKTEEKFTKDFRDYKMRL